MPDEMTDEEWVERAVDAIDSVNNNVAYGRIRVVCVSGVSVRADLAAGLLQDRGYTVVVHDPDSGDPVPEANGTLLVS